MNEVSATGLLKIDRQATQAPQRRKRLKLGMALVLALIVSAVLLRPKATEVQVVSVVLTTPSSQYQELTASGFVVAQRRAAIASKATGRLLELNVREGSRVKSGDLLARLDASDVQAQFAVAQAAVGQAQAIAAQGAALLRQSQVEFDNAQAELARSLELQHAGFVSPQALDTAQRRLDAARAGIASAQATVAQGKTGITQALAQLQVQQVNQGYTEIRAPFDGVVLAKNANVGDLITPFSNAAGSQGAVVTLADLSTLEVEADVSEGSLGKVKVGQAVEIQLDALPGQRFRGQVASIVPTVDRAKATVMTKVQFEQLDARILPEMSAKVAFLSQRASDDDLKAVLAVPAKALDGERVWKLVKDGEADKLQAVSVKPKRKWGEMVEVEVEVAVNPQLLASGDRLVARPQKLHEGQKVTVVTQ